MHRDYPRKRGFNNNKLSCTAPTIYKSGLSIAHILKQILFDKHIQL